MLKFFPQVRALVHPRTWKEMEGNREVLYSFPNWMFQIVARDNEPAMHMYMEYRPYEYYEDGTLRVRGEYADNQPRGVWKYYTEEGKFERKEKF